MIIVNNHKQYRQLWTRSSLRARAAGEVHDFQKRIARLREQVNQIDWVDRQDHLYILDVYGPGDTDKVSPKKNLVKSNT